MKIANLSDSETARNSYDKDLEDNLQKPVFLMKIANLSDSETARSSYDKDLEDNLKRPLPSTNSKSKIDSLQN